MAPQDAPKPRRLQDASQAASNRFESEVASHIAFGTPKNTSKWLPKPLQDAARTLLKTMSIETDKPTERQDTQTFSRTLWHTVCNAPTRMTPVGTNLHSTAFHLQHSSTVAEMRST